MTMDTNHCIVLALLQIAVVELALNQAVLSGQNVEPGETATFECSYSSITPTSLLQIIKDTVLIYDCGDISFPCSASSGDTDYSDVTFMGTMPEKGTFTVAHADQTRDGGDWTCSYDSSPASNTVTLVVSVTSTTVLPPADSPTKSTSNNPRTSTITSTENTTPTNASPSGVSNTSTNTTQILTKPGLSEKQRIGLIAGGVGVVVLICCSLCVCSIMRRKVNNNKRRRRQERRKTSEANVHISEIL